MKIRFASEKDSNLTSSIQVDNTKSVGAVAPLAQMQPGITILLPLVTSNPAKGASYMIDPGDARAIAKVTANGNEMSGAWTPG